MTTSRTDQLTPVPPPPADEASPAPRAAGAGRRRVVTVALLLLAALPAVFGLVDLWLDRDDPYLPFGDHAFQALVVDDVGEHEVLLGAYSRFGWYHPGPMGTYLLAASYHLLGGALQALSAGMLVVSGISAAAAVWLVRRRAGVLPAVWVLLVLTLSVRILGDEFIRNSWNPYLPVLPFLVGVLLCWTAIRGDAWALPLAVLPMSLAVQSHVGFVPAVGAVAAVLALGLLLRAVQRRRRAGTAAVDGAAEKSPRRWAVAGVVAVLLGVVLWLPAIVQQLTRTPGNAGLLYEYLLNSSPEAPAGIAVGLRSVADEFGKLPAYLVGAGGPREPLLPEGWPPAAIAVGLVCFAGALVLAAVRRRTDVLWLGALTLAVAAAGVAAVARIDGLPFPYLTQWTPVVGILAWTTVGMALLPELVAALRWATRSARRAVRPETLLAVPLAAVTAVAVLMAALGTGRAETPMTDVTGQVIGFQEAVVADLDRLGLRTGPDQPVVRVDFAGTTRPEVLVGTVWPGVGLVLGLHLDGVDVQVSPFWSVEFGERYTARDADARYVVTLAHADGTSPPPAPWQQLLAQDDEYALYGGVLPVG